MRVSVYALGRRVTRCGTHPGTIEPDISVQERVARLRLHVEGRLLLPNADLARDVVLDKSIARLVAVCAVPPVLPRRVASSAPPRDDCAVTNPLEAVADDSRISVVAGDEDRRAVEALKDAAVDRRTLCALEL